MCSGTCLQLHWSLSFLYLINQIFLFLLEVLLPVNCILTVCFSQVCHILLIVQEGSRFDPRCLRMFRTLQTAKHALAPFVKTQVLPNVVPQLAGRSSPTPRAGAASRDTVGRTGVGASAGRQSGSNGYIGGPAPVLYPGQCTPVALFVCLEELPESAPGINISGLASVDIGEATGLSSIYGGLESLGSTSSKSSKSNPGSSKPGIKTEGGVRKKTQASIEAQIRFLLKKCRTLASVVGEGGSSGSAAAALRGITGGVNAFGGAGSGGALFALDQSRAAVFVDRAHNRPGAGLEEISDMIVNFMKDPAPETLQTLDLAGTSLKNFVFSFCLSIREGMQRLLPSCVVGSSLKRVLCLCYQPFNAQEAQKRPLFSFSFSNSICTPKRYQLYIYHGLLNQKVIQSNIYIILRIYEFLYTVH